MKKIILVAVVLLLNFELFGVHPAAWSAIAKNIATLGTENNRAEFEMAKQAFLNIANVPRNRKLRESAANEIVEKYRNFTTFDQLMKETTYPDMADNPELIKEAGIKLFRNNEPFINGTLGMRCKIPEDAGPSHSE